jgi:hypothetical protein
VLGFVLGYIVCKLVTLAFFNVDRRKTEGIFRYGQIGAACAMSFMHGAQDGQKFMGVILMCLMLSNETGGSAAVQMPVWIMLLCSVIMSIGTSIGGKKIIKSIGMDMVKLEKYQGFSADLAASFPCLSVPVRNSGIYHTCKKQQPLWALERLKGCPQLIWRFVKNLMMTWILTFPGCGIIGFINNKIYLWQFFNRRKLWQTKRTNFTGTTTSRQRTPLANAADYLLECLRKFDINQINEMLAKMHGFEHGGDTVRHEMNEALAKSFVTPIDREDMAKLSQKLDHVIDCIEEVCRKFMSTT